MTPRKRQRRTPDQIIRKLAEGHKQFGCRQGTRRDVPASRDRRVDVTSLAHPVRRDEGQRREAVEGTRVGERRAEEAPRRGRARQVDTQGTRRGELLSQNRKPIAVGMLRERFGVSERRACKVVRIHRSTQRLDPPPVTDEEAQLRQFLLQFRRATAAVGLVTRREGSPPHGPTGERQACPGPLARRRPLR